MHVLVLLIALALEEPVTSGGSAFQNDVAVRGVVLDLSSHRGIPSATVYAVSGTQLRKATTDAHGRFFFFMMLPGEYTIYATQLRYTDCDQRPLRRLYAGLEYYVAIELFRQC